MPKSIYFSPFQNRIFLFSILTVISLTPGCHIFSVGHFEGNLSRTQDSKTMIQPVGIDVEKGKDKGKKQAKLKVTGRKQELLMTLEAENITSSGFSLKIPPISDTPFAMKKKGKCFVAIRGVRVDVCFENKGFFVTVVDEAKTQIFVLTGDPFPVQEVTQLEPNITIKLDDAVTRALNKNFLAEAEVEHTFQAKKGAEEQYLNLLPHLSMTTILNLAEGAFSPLSLVASIGDLAPFLLPNRWLEAKEAGNVGKAAEIGKLLMQANLIAQVEGLAYVFERDRKILLIVDQTIEYLLEKGREIQRLVQQKQLPESTFESYSSIGEDLGTTRTTMAQSLEISRAAFSNTLGYLNPEAIDFIDFGEELLDIEHASTWPEKEDLAVIAIQRSFELKQLYYLVKAAATQKLETYFTWLDPQGHDTHANLGFATGVRVEITESRIRELQTKQMQLQSIMRMKAYETVYSYNSSITNYHAEKGKYQKAAEILQARIQRIIDEKTFDRVTVQLELQRYLDKIISEQSRLATFRVARSKIDRLQLQGFYQQAVQKYLNQMIDPGIPSK